MFECDLIEPDDVHSRTKPTVLAVDELEDERRKLKKAREYAERDIQRAKKADYMREKCRPAREERLRQEEERKRREEIRRERNERCQRHLEEKKRLLEASLQERFRAFETKIRHRVNNAKLIARYRKILTLRRWNASEQERKERQEREILEKKQQKERSPLNTRTRAFSYADDTALAAQGVTFEEVELKLTSALEELAVYYDENHLKPNPEKTQDLERWYAKVQMQTERLKREKEIIRENQRQIAVRVAERSKMVERERERMDELLVEIKKKRRKSDEKRKSLALLRAITKVLEEKKGTAEAPATHLVEKTLQQTLAELRNLPEGNEPLVILSNTREKLEKEAGLPEEVTNVIDELLGRALKEHIRRTLHKLLSSTINRAMELKTKPKEDDKKLRRRSGSLLTTKPTRSKSITISERQASQLLSERKRSVTSGDVKVTRGVSFGGAIAIDEAAEGITEGRVPSSVRERPPTPVPSLTSLAEAVFEEPEFLEIVNTSEVEKEKLQKLIVNLSKILFSNVLEKTSRDERKFRSFRSFRNAAVNLDKKLNDVVTRVTEKILKESDEEVLDSDEIQYAMDSLSREVARAVLHQQELNRISSMTRTPSIMKRNG
ncbi:trichohyalin-like [Anabrus simplex]|uniref:trichohyalin-like n=1 Tax=Anabrus simplex TaxID=316456 RepID=UPI0035A34517